jgi:uncharacterized membrane protein
LIRWTSHVAGIAARAASAIDRRREPLRQRPVRRRQVNEVVHHVVIVAKNVLLLSANLWREREETETPAQGMALLLRTAITALYSRVNVVEFLTLTPRL